MKYNNYKGNITILIIMRDSKPMDVDQTTQSHEEVLAVRDNLRNSINEDDT